MNEIRKASVEDLPDILKIMQEAREFLAEQGIDQWQGVYPAAENILPDLSKEAAYVVSSDGQISVYFAIIMGDDIMYHTISQGSWSNESTDFVTVHRLAVITGEEPNYTKITDGKWSNDSLDYVTVHRIALSDEFRGQSLTKFLFSNIYSLMNEKSYRDFRVDTHEMNQIMQHVFEREGFIYRGQVIIDDLRRAYQKEL